MRHLLPIALIACGADAPVAPSFQQDALPILAANCVRCHGFPAIGGAPPEFRLDSFGDIVVSDGQPGTGSCGVDPEAPDAELTICGAVTSAAAIPFGLRDEHMRFPLGDYQHDTLENWARDPVRGTPRATNHVPSIEIMDVAQTEAVLTVRVRIGDEDGDLVTGSLRATLDRDRVIGAVRSGTLDLTFDATGVSPGDYPLVAHLDDGADLHVLSLGTLAIKSLP